MGSSGGVGAGLRSAGAAATFGANTGEPPKQNTKKHDLQWQPKVFNGKKSDWALKLVDRQIAGNNVIVQVLQIFII